MRALATGLSASSSGTVVLVQSPTAPPSTPGGQGEDFGKSSPIGLVVILLFFVAVAFLIRSMTKHLKRVPPSFDPPGEQPAERSDAPPSPERRDDPPA